jgi:hypothetical protein
METNVKSNNQSGGITVGSIHFSGPENNKKKYSIIAVMMLILTILTFFGVDQMFEKKAPDEIYHVESNNQSGGITAGKIENLNIGSQPRKLTPEIVKQLEEELVNDREKEITVCAMMGDGEAISFANEIRDYLGDNGWNVGNDMIIHFIAASTRQYKSLEIIDKKDGNIDLVVGPKDNIS